MWQDKQQNLYRLLLISAKSAKCILKGDNTEKVLVGLMGIRMGAINMKRFGGQLSNPISQEYSFALFVAGTFSNSLSWQ